MVWTGDRRVLLIAVAYVSGLAVLVFGPWGWPLNRLTVWLYVFFRTTVPVAPQGALPEDYGVLLNIAVFVPAGALLVLAARMPWWTATAVACVSSALVELLQALWLQREGSWSDVVANTAGALVGASLVSLLRRARSRRGDRS